MKSKKWEKRLQTASLTLKVWRERLKEYVFVQNAPSGDLDDRSFIQYWLEKVDNFGLFPYRCPATGKLCSREELDGAHVKTFGSKDDILYITAVHNSFNRSRATTLFLVKKRFLVIAPKQNK